MTERVSRGTAEVAAGGDIPHPSIFRILRLPEFGLNLYTVPSMVSEHLFLLPSCGT